MTERIVISHSIYIVCVQYEAISTVLVSDVILSYQMMLAISTELVMLDVNPPTTMSSLCGRTATEHRHRGVVMWLINSQELVVVLYM